MENKAAGVTTHCRLISISK